MRLSRRGLLRLGLLGTLGVVGGKGFLNSRSPRLERVTVRLKRLPPSFDGLKAAQITDIHAGPFVPPSLVRAGVDLAMSVRPDLVLLTGDFVHGSTRFLWGRVGGFKPRHYEACLTELARLSAPLGVWAVLGNHDYWSGPEALALVVRGLESIGVKVLRNEAATLERNGQTLALAGVDDYWEGPADLQKAFKGLPPEVCKILLSHNPDVNEDVETLDQPIDLIISGHTHGGQLILPYIGPPYPTPFNRRYLAGLVRDGDRQTYVSRGLGVFFVPARLNCPAEVNLLVLRRG